MKASQKCEREAAFDCSLMRGQLRIAEQLRNDGVMVPLARTSTTVQDGMSVCQDEWRSQDYYDYMKLLEGGGPQPGMPRATNQGPITPALPPQLASGSFRAKLVSARDSFNGHDARVENEKAKSSHPAAPLTSLLDMLVKETGLELDAVNSLYLKLRTWATASSEYSGVGLPGLSRIDFCKCMMREGLADSMVLASRFFIMFDTDDNGIVDAEKFVRGWALFSPSTGVDARLGLIVKLWGHDEPGWLRISEVRDALSYAYSGSGFAHRLPELDDDLCRMLSLTGTDAEGRVNDAMLSTIAKVPEWRDRFIETFNSKFAAVASTSHLGYPVQPHRSNFHDGRPGTKPTMGVPNKVWVCGPQGCLGYGGK